MRQKLFDIVFNRKPFVYALTYLLLIPTFALIYSLLPNHFYHSTAKFEYSILNPKADDILEEIKIQIQSNFTNNLKTNPFNDNSEFDIGDISLSSLKSENDKFYFKICYGDYFKVNPKDTFFAYSHGCYNLSFSHRPTLILTDPKTNQQTILKVIQIEDPISNMDTTYFRNRLKEIFFTKEIATPSLKMNQDLNDKLNEFGLTIYGFPTSFPDNYWRMFYFSSVTLTTLGFGDIVPVTNTSRILISIEAILGVVLIGLFLNALSKRVKQ